MSPSDITFIRKVTKALILARHQLGYELSHAEGLMTDDTLKEVLDDLLAQKEKPENLVEACRYLKTLVDFEFFDAELIMVVFDCTLDEAMDAVLKV